MEPRTYKVTKIDGDYAHLPDETDEGTMLHWENFIYTVIE